MRAPDSMEVVMPNHPTAPRYGEAVHYVEHRGLRCTTALVNGTTHPGTGDDNQWCLSLDTFVGGQAVRLRDHVPHGNEAGHWHTDKECTR